MGENQEETERPALVPTTRSTVIRSGQPGGPDRHLEPVLSWHYTYFDVCFRVTRGNQIHLLVHSDVSWFRLTLPPNPEPRRGSIDVVLLLLLLVLLLVNMKKSSSSIQDIQDWTIGLTELLLLLLFFSSSPCNTQPGWTWTAIFLSSLLRSCYSINL